MKFIVYEKSREHSRIPWSGKQLIIGRRTDADIQLNEPTMSGIHAKIFAGVDGIRIRDLNSLNGTQINGSRIVESRLRSGDQIRIGRTTILVSGSPSSDFSDDSTEVVSFTLEEKARTAQTLKITLDELRQAHGVELGEDNHIILLRNLFEALQSAADHAERSGTPRPGR